MSDKFPLFNKNYYLKNQIVLPEHNKNRKKSGNQIYHYCSENINTFNHSSTKKYIKKNLSTAIQFTSDAEILLYGLNIAIKNYPALEFGVCSGKTINTIAAHFFSTTVYGFDSFDGIPEDWHSQIKKGDFELLDKTQLPPLLNNVVIYNDLFEKSLPIFTKHINDTFVSFIHIDCDIYSSTKSIFLYLRKNIKKGTVILFDEYFNYDDWKHHEYKAFSEFVSDYGLSYKYIAYNKLHQQVLVEII